MCIVLFNDLKIKLIYDTYIICGYTVHIMSNEDQPLKSNEDLNFTAEEQDKFQEKEKLFHKIKEEIEKKITKEDIVSLVTKSGNTQEPERNYISKVQCILDEMNLNYERAGSQQSKDFRNVGDIHLDIEVKKTDSDKVLFNDTCPSKNIFYIIFCTTKKKKKYSPQMLFVNGMEFLEGTEEWQPKYQQKIKEIKDEFCLGENKKKLAGILEAYARPNYKCNISTFLK